MTMSPSILLKNGTLLLPSSGSSKQIEPRKTDLLISGNLIARIEDQIDPTFLGSDVTVIDCSDKIVSPGFVDTHRHVWQTQFKGTTPNHTLLEYLPRGNLVGSFYEPDDIYWGTLGGLLESIDAGTTTIVDHAHMQYSPDHVRKGIAAHVASGIRSTYGYCPTPRVSSWTPDLAFAQDVFPSWIMETFEQLGKEAPFGENGRVRLGFAFDGLFLPDDMVKNIFTSARSKGAQLVTLHYTNNNPILRGEPAIERFHDLSLLQSDTLFSHANGMTALEVSLLRNANAHISSTPATEMGMGLGDPVPATHPELCTHEHVSLGVDCHSYIAADTFTHLRLLVAAVRSSHNRQIVNTGNHPKSIAFSVEDAFLIATMGGANAVGMSSEIGSLEVGKRADVVIFDTSNSPGMVMAAENDAVAAVVLHASVRDVEMVIVDGKIRKSGGKLLPLEGIEGVTDGSWGSISAKLRESAQAVFKRTEGVDFDVATEQLVELWGIDKKKLV